jgi:hypothetical protein
MELRRGFHRIGLVGLVPLCVLSLPLFAYAIYIWMTAPPVADYYALGPLPYGAIESGILGLAALAMGFLWYLSCWAVAWIVAGFQSD